MLEVVRAAARTTRHTEGSLRMWAERLYLAFIVVCFILLAIVVQSLAH
jgi:multidrug transporter EmrE-like cation transporter